MAFIDQINIAIESVKEKIRANNRDMRFIEEKIFELEEEMDVLSDLDKEYTGQIKELEQNKKDYLKDHKI